MEEEDTQSGDRTSSTYGSFGHQSDPHPAYASVEYSRDSQRRSSALTSANPNTADTSGLYISRASFDDTNQLRRQGSRGLFSRLRLRSSRADSTAEFRGDFVIHDFINAKTRSHLLEAEHQRESGGRLVRSMYVLKIYIVLISVGIGAGLVAAALDMSVDWLSDIKFGICSNAWYLSEEMCCRFEDEGSACAFRPWIHVFPFLRYLPFSHTAAAVLSYSLFAIVFAVFAAFLVKRFAPHAAGSGVPEIKTVLSGVVIRGYLNSWAFVTKVIGLAFSVSSGLNLGKEGPFVHLVSVLANMVATSFSEFRDDFAVLMEFITVGTAAGVAVAFNAPVGGVLFAFEEAASYFPNRVLWRSFFAAALAELTLKVMNPFFNGRTVMFEIDHTIMWYWFELIIFFGIGVLGGVLGSIFIHFNVKYSKLRIHHPFLKKSPIIEVVIIMLITILLQYPVPFLRFTNTQLLAALFGECPQPGEGEGNASDFVCSDNSKSFMAILLYATLAKLFLTTLTFGARIPAGLFIPSMTIGACAGRLIGMITERQVAAFPDWIIFRECLSTSKCVQPSMYAVVGASSTLAGVTQVSVSLVVIMFELTGGLSHLLPIMFGILAAKLVCDISGLEGIYDMHINIKRYPYLDSKHHVSHTVASRVIMRPPLIVIPEIGVTLGWLKQLLVQHQYYGFPIVRTNEDMILTGNIVRSELSTAIDRALESSSVTLNTKVSFKGEFDETEINQISSSNEIFLNFAGYRDRYLCQVSPSTPVSDVYDCFSLLGVRMCFVTRHGELLGLISKKDIIAYCDAEGDVPRKFFS